MDERTIEILTDPIPAVCQAARRSLIILSFLALNPDETALIASQKPSRPPKTLSQLKRPVDFGPAPFASRAAQKSAAKKWTEWWEKSKKDTQFRLVVSTLSTSERPLPETEAGHLAAALLQAPGPRQTKLLKEYQESKGEKYTGALAIAASRLTSDHRHEVRKALAERLARMTEYTLGNYLEDEDPEVRRAAVLALAMRESLVHVPRMINMLSDPEAAVTRAVVASLRSLSGKDFGPKLGATQEEQEEAVARWKEWATKEGFGPTDSSRLSKPPTDPPGVEPRKPPPSPGAGVESPTKPPTTRNPPPLVGPGAEEEASQMGKVLVSGAGPKLDQVLTRLREGKGSAFTEALAQAIHNLEGDVRKKAQRALAERMARMSAETLGDKLRDPDPEIRRATCLACAMREETTHFARLIDLLQDPEPLVARAARAALKSLSGQDFGPEEDATQAERTTALEKWKNWWKNNEKK